MQGAAVIVTKRNIRRQGIPASLTVKQELVCNFVVAGLSSKEIAQRLGIAPRTVEGHRAAIYRKMGVSSVIELVRKTLGAE